MNNPWPGNFDGLVSLPRLRRTGPPASVTSPVPPVQLTYIPFFANFVWTLIANNNGGLGTYSGDTFSVSSTSASTSYSRALGTLTYTSATPLAGIARIIVTVDAVGYAGGFFVFVDGVQTQIIRINNGGAPILPLGLSIVSIGTLPAGSHVVLIKGLTDIGQPSRLFSYSGGGNAGAYSVQFQLA